MYEYLKGIITKQFANYIVVDVSGVGYRVYTPNPYRFKIDEEEIVYVYNHVREDENTLYGFTSEDERDLFLKLIDVKGLGPRMAITILATNILYLKKIPKIGEKLARQIILDLKGKLVMSENNTIVNDELTLALEALGYKSNDIKNVVSKVDTALPIESQIKEALKLLLK